MDEKQRILVSIVIWLLIRTEIFALLDGNIVASLTSAIVFAENNPFTSYLLEILAHTISTNCPITTVMRWIYAEYSSILADIAS